MLRWRLTEISAESFSCGSLEDEDGSDGDELEGELEDLGTIAGVVAVLVTDADDEAALWRGFVGLAESIELAKR